MDDSLKSIMGMAQGATTVQGLSQGMALAGQAQDLDKQKVQLEQMKDQLDTAKFNKAMSSMQTLARTSPDIAKRMVPKIQDNLRSAGIPVDPGVLDVMASDENYKARFQAISGALSGQATNPAARQQALQAFGDIGEFDKGLSAFEANNKLAAQVQMKDSQIQGMKDAAQIRGDATVKSAQIKGANSLINSSTRASALYSKDIMPTEKAVQQGHRVLDIIGKIEDGDLKSTKTLSADMDAATASLLAGGKPSTVFGQQAVHGDDLYERVKNGIQFVTAHPQDTQAPAKLAQLKADVKALDEFYDVQHQQSYSSWRQGLDAKLRPNVDNRYKVFRKANNMDTGILEDGADGPVAGQAPAAGGQQAPAAGQTAAPPPGQQQQTAPPPAATPVDVAGFVKLFKGKKTDDQITKFLVGKGADPKVVQAALKGQ